jgi:hypothetical protein
MKITKHLFLLTFLLTGLLSCSDDNNDTSPSNNNYGPKNVFTGELPKSVGNATLKYNSDGLLEEISDNKYEKITFEYPPKTKSTNIVIMKVIDLENEKYSYIFNLEIGDNGFIKNAIETYFDNSTDTWEFKYNSDGQLNYMKRSEGGDEVTTIAYTNGNITSSKTQEAEEDGYSATIIYTSNNKAIENKGCIMLFDETLGIDMDEMNYAYYAGLLGRSTKHLPLENERASVGETNTYRHIFNWALNKEGYPTKFTDDDGDRDIEFGW